MKCHGELDVSAWLQALGLGQYASAFAANDIDPDLLRQLSADDLKEIGVDSLGHRKRILAAVAALEGGTGPAATAPQAEGARRQVSILFADLCGFTALSRTLDPELLHDLVSQYTALVDSIVESYGGSVDKHIGNSVMALFGAPVAHGDDPARAARCALEIHQAVAGLGARMGHPLLAHVGIANGEVVAGGVGRAGGHDYTVLGNSVNLAARLVALAEPGQTLVSDKMFASLAGRAVCDALGTVAMKGFDAPNQVWRLRALAADTAETARPFVGRQAELEQFKGAMAACLRTGSGQIVFLRGDAGIGKTRLVAEMTRLAAEARFAAHRGLVLDFGMGRRQDPALTVALSILGLGPGSDAAARQAAADAAVAAGRVAPDDAVFLAELLDLPMPPAMRTLYDAMDHAARNAGRRELMRGLVASAGRTQPVLIVIEDLHWADPATLAMLTSLAAGVAAGPALLVLTARRDGDPIDAAWRARCADVRLTTIDVGPLRREEAMAFASALPESSLALACVERAQGNPLFLEQLLRNAEEGAKELVPSSIQSLILARMDRLAPLDRRALQAASVIGQRVDLPTLRHMMDAPDYDCAKLIEHALLRPEDDGYLFAHALVQEGIYLALLKARRRELHSRAAAWFGARGDAVLRAQHLERAEDAAAAHAYFEAAAAQAAAYHAERAMALVERGLSLVSDANERLDLICLKGELFADLGMIAESIAQYRAALAVAGDDGGRCRALLGLAGGLRVSEGLDEALLLLDEAQTIAARHDLVLELARIHHLRGNIFFPLGRIDGCREQHEFSLAQARRSGLAEAEARALGGLGDAAYAQGRMRTAFDSFSGCVALCRQHGFGRIEVANRSMVGFSRLYLNEPAQAREDGVETAEMAARVGHLRAELLGETMGAMASGELGADSQARLHLQRANELATQLGAQRFAMQNMEFEGQLLCARGRRQEATALLRDAVALGRRVGLQFCGPKTMSALAVATEDACERGRMLVEAVHLLGLGSVGHNHLLVHRDGMEAMLLAGDWAGVRRHADALAAYTRAETLPWSELFISRGRALADLLIGRETALAALEAVRAKLTASGMVTYLAVVDAVLGGGDPAAPFAWAAAELLARARPA